MSAKETPSATRTLTTQSLIRLVATWLPAISFAVAVVTVLPLRILGVGSCGLVEVPTWPFALIFALAPLALFWSVMATYRRLLSRRRAWVVIGLSAGALVIPFLPNVLGC